jgi:hypothetical protein
MTRQASPEGGARAVYLREWRRAGGNRPGADWVIPEWMVDELLSLVQRSADQPAEHLTPHVRQLLLEQSFIDENGDSVCDANWTDRVEQTVQRMIGALENVRVAAVAQGMWSSARHAPDVRLRGSRPRRQLPGPAIPSPALHRRAPRSSLFSLLAFPAPAGAVLCPGHE